MICPFKGGAGLSLVFKTTAVEFTSSIGRYARVPMQYCEKEGACLPAVVEGVWFFFFEIRKAVNIRIIITTVLLVVSALQREIGNGEMCIARRILTLHPSLPTKVPGKRTL